MAGARRIFAVVGGPEKVRKAEAMGALGIDHRETRPQRARLDGTDARASTWRSILLEPRLGTTLRSLRRGGR